MREFVFTNFNLNLLDSNFHELEVDNDEDPLNFLENLEQRLLERKKFFVQCNNLPEVQIKYLEELPQKHNYNSYVLLLNDSLSLFLRVLSLNPKTSLLMDIMKDYFYCKLKIESLSLPILNVQSLEFIKNHKFNFRESLKQEYEYAIDRLKDNYIDGCIYCYEECMNLVDYNKMNFKNCKLRAR